MNIIIGKIFFSIFFITAFFFQSQVYSKSQESYKFDVDISNYFLGIISLQENDLRRGLDYLSKAEAKTHKNYNVKMTQTLVELEKFKEVISYLKKLETDKRDFDQANLLLGLHAFKMGDFLKAESYFLKLNSASEINFYSEDFLGNILISWIKVVNNEPEEAHKYIQKVPQVFFKLKIIQKAFIKCFLDEPGTKSSYKKIIKDLKITRYNFFLMNYLLKKNEIREVRDLIGKDAFVDRLLLRHSKLIFYQEDYKKLKKYFDCQNPKHAISEFFYFIANLYSSENDYILSNFYLKLSFYMNNDFYFNKDLLAENYYYLKKYDDAKKIYFFLKKEGEIYSWHSSRRIAHIKSITENNEKAISFLEREYKKIKNKNFSIFYEFANFYKDMQLYEKSIEYYTLALENLPEDHSLKPQLLYRRGSSYERLGLWDNFEKDLEVSLKISPEQPYVLNYLAYAWLDKEINLERALEMLKKANSLRENDPYIVDSLGWAYYLLKNYSEAEKLIKQVVQVMPRDPIVNDHYADILWKLDRNIQARYLWNQILDFEEIEDDLKEKINHKLTYGMKEKL